MASIHEELEECESRGNSPELSSTSDSRQRYTAQHAQLAMSELSKILAARPEATEIAMMNCILFVLLDFMVGNFASMYHSFHPEINSMPKLSIYVITALINL